MKATTSLVLAALAATSTQAISLQSKLSQNHDLDEYRNDEQAIRALHIIDQDGDYEISMEELQAIISIAFQQDRITFAELQASLALVSQASAFLPATFDQVFDFFSLSNDYGAEELMHLLHLVEDSAIELEGDWVHWWYDYNDNGTLSAREFVNLVRDELDWQFDYFLDEWDNRVGQNGTLELSEFQGFWEELVANDNMLREDLLNWHAYNDLI